MNSIHQVVIPKSCVKTQVLAEITPVPQSAKRSRSTWSFSPETIDETTQPNLKHPIRSVSMDEKSPLALTKPLSTKVPICKFKLPFIFWFVLSHSFSRVVFIVF